MRLTEQEKKNGPNLLDCLTYLECCVTHMPTPEQMADFMPRTLCGAKKLVEYDRFYSSLVEFVGKWEGR